MYHHSTILLFWRISALIVLALSPGILRYRGYPIEQLAEKSNFLESAYLLIYGELPTPTQYENWSDGVVSTGRAR